MLLFFNAAVCLYPLDTAVQEVPPAIVCTGEDRFVITLIPNCPKELFPQFQRVPSVFTAAAKRFPADTCSQDVPPPNICTGDDLLITVLSPMPPSVFAPHSHNVPSVFIAAVI